MNELSSGNGNVAFHAAPLEDKEEKSLGLNDEPKREAEVIDDRDETFITSVNISEDSQFKDEVEESYPTDIPLPLTLRDSIKALRIALKNPASYERVKDASFTKETYAFKRRLAEIRPRFDLPESLRRVGEPRQTLPPIKSKETRRIKEKAAIRPQKDEFLEMKQNMKMVDEKLELLEANLATIMKSKVLEKQLAASLLSRDVKTRYNEIQEEFMNEALQEIQKETEQLKRMKYEQSLNPVVVTEEQEVKEKVYLKMF